MKAFLRWVDANIFLILGVFLSVFIPLYPKLPLFEVLPGYIVRVRLEDILVSVALGCLVIQLARAKTPSIRNPVSLGIMFYLAVGLVSSLVAIFVIHTVPQQYIHAGKTLFHWLRRLEYFSLFFLVLVSLTSAKRIKYYVVALFLTLFGVVVYGYGQKYLYWPAFSTMNREFSKGWLLYLTEHARVLSTFGGHYDLAGYLVIVLTLGWSFFLGMKSRIWRGAIGILLASGFWLLILTASRISFIALLSGISVVTFLWSLRKGLIWGLSRWAAVIFSCILVMLLFGDLSDRFLHLFNLSGRLSAIRQMVLSPSSRPPNTRAVFLENNQLAVVTSYSDQPPTPIKPRDVSNNELPLLIPVRTASGSMELVERKRTYSKNALMFDLSTGIRLDTTWPRAIAGFKRDPLFGSGYATLTKETIEQFTEAESTDNDYLRSLGETGFLGFAAFFGTLLLMVWIALKSLIILRSNYYYALVAGYVGLVIGLLLNALTIDIFEASKVAYVFWSVSGLTMGAMFLRGRDIGDSENPIVFDLNIAQLKKNIRGLFFSDIVWVGLILALSLGLRFYKLDAPLADWHSWRQADTSAVTRNFVKYHRIDLLHPVFDDLSSVASGIPNPLGLRYVEFPLYNGIAASLGHLIPEVSVETTGRLTTALMSSISVLFLFLISRKLFTRRIGYLAAVSFALLPYNIFYGRVILPDPSMVTMTLGALWFMIGYLFKKRSSWLIASAIFSAAALLIKPYAIFLLIPIIYLWLVELGLNKRILALLLYFVLTALPLLLWRIWIRQHPEGIPASSWLFNGDGIRFKGAFWYWIFADRVGRLILGYWGIFLLGLGVIRKNPGRFGYFPVIFLLSSLSYVVVFATGNVRHDYYQILLTPALAIATGLGLDWLFFESNFMFHKWIARLLGLVAAIFTLLFGWYFVRELYNINHPEIVEAGRKLESLSDYRALVVAPYDGDTAFLYQTNRQGWPIVEGSVDHLISLGADYYVSVRFDDLTNALISQAQKPSHLRSAAAKDYKIIALNTKFVIIQLVPDGRLPHN